MPPKDPLSTRWTGWTGQRRRRPTGPASKGDAHSSCLLLFIHTLSLIQLNPAGPTPNTRDTQLPPWWVGPGTQGWETGQKDEQVTYVILSNLLQKVIHHGNAH